MNTVLADTVQPEHEADRVAAVRRYDVLDTPPDGAFDRITAIVARLLDVPIAIVSIVDTDRIWFKSHHGLEATEIGRDPGLCASAILQDDAWVVTDAAVDPRTLANPLVASDFGLRFYVGIPLTTHDGFNLGTLCALDTKPREVTTAEVETLKDLADVVMDELELRRTASERIQLESQARRRAEELARTLQDGLLPDKLPEVPGLELAARYHVAHQDEVGGDFYDVFDTESGCAAVVGDARGKGVAAASLTGTARWALRTRTLEPWTPLDALFKLNQVLVDGHADPEKYCTVGLIQLRPDRRGLTVALGGHPAPLILHADGSFDAPGETGPAIGWLAESEFTQTTSPVNPGDVVLMFTDGLMEAISGHGCSDTGPIREVLAPLAGASAMDVADALDRAIGRDILDDDAAFLVLRIH